MNIQAPLDKVIIRKLTEEEIPAALELAWKVFLEYEAPVYPAEGTEEFRRCLHDEKYLSGIEYYGAFCGSVLSGIVGIRKASCHICFFFVEGQRQRQGLGTRLFSALKMDFPDRSITLNSAPYGLPFYRSLGFTESEGEQTVNGIRFTPMILNSRNARRDIVKLCERRDLKDAAAGWFASKWSIPEETYRRSMEESFSSTVPSWYLCMESGKIIAGAGVIDNDFHDRKDLTPNVCAVYTESFYRNQGIAGRLLDHICRDMAAQGIETLYLITNHTGFYERYGWVFHCMVQGDGEDEPSRMYIHRMGQDKRDENK